MNTKTFITALSLAASQHSFAAVSWIPVGAPTVNGTFADATPATAAGWDATAGTYTQVPTAGAGAQGSTGYGLVRDPDGLDPANDVFTVSIDGRTSAFPAGGYAVLTSVLLDNTWQPGSGFDYSIAINDAAGNHRRDFTTSIGYSGGTFRFSAANGANFDLIGALNPALNPVDLGPLSSGWYNLQTVFYDVGGVLNVDLNLLNSTGNMLATRTLSSPADTIAGLGGHRYSWMTGINTPTNNNQVGIDSYSIQNIQVVPEPGTTLLGGLAGLVFLRRRRA